MTSLEEYISSENELIEEAAEAINWQFSKCTYDLGYIRQPVFLCLTCQEVRGICSACSVACHTDHEQIELFPKRNFRCDCPTLAIPHSCTLQTSIESANEKNEYGKNFKAIFCRCGRPYDARTEPESMIQCLACEDWFHESCCNLRERPALRQSSPTNETTGEASPDDLRPESSELPPGLISADDYECFVCSPCVSTIPTLRRYAGTPGALVVIRSDASEQWRVSNGNGQEDPSLGQNTTSNKDVDDSALSTMVGSKRQPSVNIAGEPIPKKPRKDLTEDDTSSTSTNSSCLAPSPNVLAQKIFSDKEANHFLGTGDVFLTNGFRERWCHCSDCIPSLQMHPYLLTEEETYEPPEDPDSGLSLEELGLRALNTLPRDRAIDGIHAFNAMRDDLVRYLRPFAHEGKVITKSDIESFFQTLNEKTD